MNKKYITCGAVILFLSIAIAEGLPIRCDDCEKKRQLHIEVSQPTGIVQQIRTSVVAGISATATTTTLNQPNNTDSSESEV